MMSSVSVKTLSCEQCEKKFSRYVSLKRHIKYVHEKLSEIICELCGKKFCRPDELTRHMRSHGGTLKKSKCPICFICLSTEEIADHFLKQHKLVLKSYIKEFNSMNEFMKWKDDFEETESSNYVKPCGSQQITDGSVVHYYICHRSGNYIKEGKDKRQIKITGSSKINSQCPSKIKVIEAFDGKVTAFITETHAGHETDIGYLRIAKSTKADIANKIAHKIPFDKILDDYRNDIGDSLLRSSLITRQDLFNIASAFNLKHEAIRHDNDYVSVEAFVKEMQEKGENNIIRLFKPQNRLSISYPQLTNDDFFLIIIAPAQIELLKEFGSNLISVDGTHGLTPYDFELVTVMVVDELRQGFPVAFLFTNRTDQSAMEVFFSVIKQAIGFQVNPAVFMSDMADAFYNAWCTIMGPVRQRLYCSWHVHKAWRSNLNKISLQEKRSETYKLLKVLSAEQDENAFQIMLENFIKDLKADPETAEFGKYFDSTYKKCSTAWAYCYRNHIGINTNMHLERMHRAIKYEYLKGNRVKRFDIGLHEVMRYYRDKLCDRMITLIKGKVAPKISDLRKKHKKAVEQVIKKPAAQDEQKGDQWCVRSSNGTNMYDVVPSNSACNCKIFCSICMFCLHKFKCSCPDSTVLLNMCKHIHAVGIEILKEESDKNNYLLNTSSTDSFLMTTDYENNKIKENTKEEEINIVFNELKSDQQKLKLNEKIKVIRQSCERICNDIQNEDEANYLEKALLQIERIKLAMRNSSLESGIPQLKRDNSKKKKSGGTKKVFQYEKEENR